MFHTSNLWDPFGDDRPANQAAIEALQTAAELAVARRVYDLIPAGRLAAEYRQREHHDRLGADLDAFADRAGLPRDLFREVLQRKLRRDHGGTPDLTPLPGRPPHDDDRRALEREVLLAEQAVATSARHQATAEKRVVKCGCLGLLERRQHETGRKVEALNAARAALSAYDRGAAA